MLMAKYTKQENNKQDFHQASLGSLGEKIYFDQ